MRDPVACCEKCGVQPPLSLIGRRSSSSSARLSATADSGGATGGGDGDSFIESSGIDDDDPFSPLAANVGGDGSMLRGRLSSSSLGTVEIQVRQL